MPRLEEKGNPPPSNIAHTKICLGDRSRASGLQTFSPPPPCPRFWPAASVNGSEGSRLEQPRGRGRRRKRQTLSSLSVPAVPALSPLLSPFASSSAYRPQTRMNAGFSPDQQLPAVACPRVPGAMHPPRSQVPAQIDPAMFSPGDLWRCFAARKEARHRRHQRHPKERGLAAPVVCLRCAPASMLPCH
jgi:hypothetical protein